MPPKQKISRQDIIATAFEMLKTQGIKAINARAICTKLNCSTQPIFSQFKNMEELKAVLLRKARDLYNEYIEKALKEEKPFKASGLAYIRFARNEPILFSLLFMKDNKGINPANEEFDENHQSVLSGAVKATGFVENDARDLLLHLWIYTHGIATLLATNTVLFTDEQISQMLTHDYNGLIKNYSEKL